jgi:hypothetical protein
MEKFGSATLLADDRIWILIYLHGYDLLNYLIITNCLAYAILYLNLATGFPNIILKHTAL